MKLQASCSFCTMFCCANSSRRLVTFMKFSRGAQEHMAQDSAPFALPESENGRSATACSKLSVLEAGNRISHEPSGWVGAAATLHSFVYRLHDDSSCMDAACHLRACPAPSGETCQTPSHRHTRNMLAHAVCCFTSPADLGVSDDCSIRRCCHDSLDLTARSDVDSRSVLDHI